MVILLFRCPPRILKQSRIVSLLPASQVQGYSISRYEKLKRSQNARLAAGKGRDVFPAEFTARLKAWPKLLQKEIDEQSQKVRVTLEACDNDWSELEQRGIALGGLKLQEQKHDPFRGYVMILSHRERRARGFGKGAPVVLCHAGNLGHIVECTLVEVENYKVTLATRKGAPELDMSLEYVILPSQNSGAIQSLQRLIAGDFAKDVAGEPLLQFAFRGKPMPSVHNDRIPSSLSDELNESQARAVAAALNKKRPFVCIQGPPGTGKTRVVAEIIRQLVEKRIKVLVCAPTHVAVDNALQKTLEVMEKESEEEDPLDCLAHQDHYDSVSNAEDIETAITSHERYPELKKLGEIVAFGKQNNRSVDKAAKEFRYLKQHIYKSCYKRRNVIFCTVSSSVIQRLEQLDWFPEVIIIDEAAMCIEPWSWAALLKARRCILVGDQAQLPAIVVSKQGLREKLNVSLMERLIASFPNSNLVHMLTTQYRMNKAIMRWSSDTFYESQLTAHNDVADIKLSDISAIAIDHPFNEPLMMINTDVAPFNLYRSVFKEEEWRLSYRNTGEAELLADYARLLSSRGVSKRSIGVITPYYAQAQLIREILDDPEYSVNTVDSFQGQQREVVLFSMVRHNAEGTLGFLRDARRMNVAVTRARRQFALFGSARMMKNDKQMHSLFRAIETRGKVFDPTILRIDEEIGARDVGLEEATPKLRAL